MPPAGSSMPPGGPTSGAFALSGSFGAAGQTSGSRELRLLKTQLALAVGQREEDPERAWLELVSVRERLHPLADTAREDPLLHSDLQRFRGKLEDQIAKMTREVGDEVIAPLYSWIDLVRQRARLEEQVANATQRVGEARASRGAARVPVPSTEEDTATVIAAAEQDRAAWSAEIPPRPSPEIHTAWLAAGGDALRPGLPSDLATVRARGLAARPLADHVQGRTPGEVPYVGSKLELVLLPTFGAAALLLSTFAFATAQREMLGVLAALGWVAFAGVIAVSVAARQRADVERKVAVEAMWHHVLATEQATSFDLEVGWLKALSAALRARAAFDAHEAEGKQLAALATWRPDLEPVVVEVAKSSIAPPA